MDLSDRQRLSAIAHTGSLLWGIGFGHANVRLAGALVALLTFPIGLEASATLQSSALLVVLIAVILVRPRRAMVCQ